MRLWKLPYSVPGHLVTACTLSLLVMGPVACNGLAIPASFTLPALDSSGIPVGFLINSDPGSGVLGGIRLDDGSAFFVYGTQEGDAQVPNITAAVFRDAAGQEASVQFDGGWPTAARSFDGSTVEITYDLRGPERFKGEILITFTDESLAEEERIQTIPFDVDVLQTAREVANQVADFFDLTISGEEPPKEPPGRPRLADSLPVNLAKDAQHSQFILWMFAPFYQFAFATVGFACIQIMTQLVSVMVQAMVGVIVSMTMMMVTAMMTAMFAPFIMMGNMMRMATSLSMATVNFAIDLHGAGVLIPTHPRI